MSKSKRHTRSGAGRSVSQANVAAFHSKLLGLCQYEIIIAGILEIQSNVRLSKSVVGAW